MKKFLAITLAIFSVFSLTLLSGCAENAELKMGMGVYSYYDTVRNAEADSDGNVEMAQTVAAVLVDKDGKIVACDIDSVVATGNFTSSGKFISAEEFKSKDELGDNYGMVAYGKAKKEWYAQADAFCSLAIGKTLDEVKALEASGGKGNDDVISAGCTITVSDFVKAIEKAVNTATACNAGKKDTVKIGIVAAQTVSDCKDATADADGVCVVDSAFSAVALKGDKVTAMLSDALTAKFTFDVKGVSTTKTDAEIVTKKDAGANYGMSKYGTDLNKDGTVKEWFEQADAFNAACVGKTADEISALAINGYGVDSLQSAGCTIAISDMVKAAVKAATI